MGVWYPRSLRVSWGITGRGRDGGGVCREWAGYVGVKLARLTANRALRCSALRSHHNQYNFPDDDYGHYNGRGFRERQSAIIRVREVRTIRIGETKPATAWKRESQFLLVACYNLLSDLSDIKSLDFFHAITNCSTFDEIFCPLIATVRFSVWPWESIIRKIDRLFCTMDDTPFFFREIEKKYNRGFFSQSWIFIIYDCYREKR